MWWKHEKKSFSAVGAYTFRADCMLPFQYIFTKNKTKGKQQLVFVFCKRKKETTNFHLFAANGNGKRKFVFIGWQMINSNQGLLFQQTCPSMLFTHW
jgi:hypothetical protein